MRFGKYGGLALALLGIAYLSFASDAISPAFRQDTGAAATSLSEASRQWLDEVVPYIITTAERRVFLTLPNEVERGRFIEAFWKKRDTDPSTPENEFQKQYYLRIALANEFFGGSGIDGWRTDRGRIFILLGPPHEIQREFNVSVSSLYGGIDREIWQYWGLPNPKLPYNVEFAFVDRHGNGRFVIDRSLAAGRIGKTPDLQDLTFQFDVLEMLAEAQRNPFDKLDRVKTLITTQVTYELIPFDYRILAFRGADGRTHLPLLVEVPFASLPSKAVEGRDEFSINITVHISDPLGRVVAQRTKDFSSHADRGRHDLRRVRALEFQTSLDLDPGTYGLHLIVWDSLSGKMGTRHDTFSAPDFSAGELAASDIVIYAGEDGPADPSAAPSDPSPSLLDAAAKREFSNGDELGVAIEVYNLKVSPETGRASLKAEFAFLKEGQVVLQVPAFEPEPTAETECLVRNSLRLSRFRPGEYKLRVTVTDTLAGSALVKETAFSILR